MNPQKYEAVVSNLALFKQMKQRDEEVKAKEQRDKLRKLEYYENLRNPKRAEEQSI